MCHFLHYRSLAQRMRLVTDPEDFLGNPSRLVLDTDLIRSVLNSLTPTNSIVLVGTHHVNFSDDLNIAAPHVGPPSQSSLVDLPWPELDKLEPIYSTPFAILDIPLDLENYWNGSGGSVSELHLPEENDFIPENFNILSPPPNPSDSPVKVELANSTSLIPPSFSLLPLPLLFLLPFLSLFHSMLTSFILPSVHSGVSLWWLQDTAFRTPHINMYCSISAQQPNTSSVRWSGELHV